MQQYGEVVEIKGSMAIIKFKRGKACEHCSGCISFSSTEAQIEVENILNAKVGDRVELVLHERSMLKASLIAYMGPLAALIIGVLIGSIWGEIYAAIGGVACALLAFMVLRLLEPKFERMAEFKPRMISIIND